MKAPQEQHHGPLDWLRGASVLVAGCGSLRPGRRRTAARSRRASSPSPTRNADALAEVRALGAASVADRRSARRCGTRVASSRWSSPARASARTRRCSRSPPGARASRSGATSSSPGGSTRPGSTARPAGGWWSPAPTARRRRPRCSQSDPARGRAARVGLRQHRPAGARRAAATEPRAAGARGRTVVVPAALGAVGAPGRRGRAQHRRGPSGLARRDGRLRRGEGARADRRRRACSVSTTGRGLAGACPAQPDPGFPARRARRAANWVSSTAVLVDRAFGGRRSHGTRPDRRDQPARARRVCWTRWPRRRWPGRSA